MTEVRECSSKRTGKERTVSISLRSCRVGIFVLLIGICLNFIVIASNGWKMPVVSPLFHNLGIEGEQIDEIHFVADSDSKFLFLSDWIEVCIPSLNINILASPGDFFIYLALPLTVLPILLSILISALLFFKRKN